jgi:hypothetical protein
MEIIWPGSGSVSGVIPGTDPDPSINKQNIEKNLDLYSILTSK